MSTPSAEVPSDYERVARAIRYLDEHRSRQPSVAEVAAHLHLSEPHLHRLFRRWAGVSPKAYLQHTTAEAARELLRGRRVLHTALELGLSSAGRLHDLVVAVDAMTPGQAGGAALTIAVGEHATRFGRVGVGVTDRGVCALRFLAPRETAAGVIARRWPHAALVADRSATREAARAVDAATAAGRDQPLRLHVHGTNLQLKVWEALLTLEPGQVTTYGDVAAAVGRPGAARAAANAVGSNPIAVLIPCHRVLRSTGALGGYAWGVTRKHALLAAEATALASSGVGSGAAS